MGISMRLGCRGGLVRPVLLELAAVLAAVKDAARRYAVACGLP